MILGENIYFRGVEEEDLTYRVSWLNDPEVSRTLNFENPVTLAGSKQWLSRVTADSSRKDFTLFLRGNDNPIGYCGFLGIDWKVRKAEIYGGIGDTSQWGHGLGKEMWWLMIRYGFDVLALNRLWATVWTENFGMRRVNEYCGMQEEGILRKDVLSHGEYRDRIVYGILREEYLSLVDSGPRG